MNAIEPVSTSALPERLDIPAAWIGADMHKAPDLWRWHLSATEVAELEDAARAFIAQSRDMLQLRPETFVVPSLRAKLEALSATLIHGIGFEVIRGLPVDRIGVELASTIFCGIGAHLGRARSQNADGHLLGHVRDVGADSRDPNTRSTRQGNAKLSIPIRRMWSGCCGERGPSGGIRCW